MYIKGNSLYHYNHQVIIEISQTPGKSIIKIENPGIWEISPVDGQKRQVFSHFILGDTCYIYSKWLNHHWEYLRFNDSLPWHYTYDLYLAFLSVVYSYYTSPFTIVYSDGSRLQVYGRQFNFPLVIINEVSKGKRGAAFYARNLLYMGNEIFWQGFGLSITGFPYLLPIAVPLMALGKYYMIEAKMCIYEAYGCINYDVDYMKAINFQTLKKEIKNHEKTPADIKDYIKELITVSAIEEASRITYNRFLSALKEDNKDAIDLQKKTLESLLTEIEDKLSKLSKKQEKAKDVFRKEFQKVSKHEKKNEAIDEIEKIKAVGFSDKHIERLKAKKYTDEEIQTIEKYKHKISAAVFYQDPTPNIERIQNVCYNKLEKVKERIADVQRIYSLDKNDQLRELLVYGFISAEEFQEKRDWNHEESNYLIEEISILNSDSLLSLKKEGIHTTTALLKKCLNPSSRTELAKKIEIEKEKLNLSVNIADLMRIKGISDEYYRLLADIGIKSITDLTKKDSRKFYEQITKHIEKTKWEGETPTEELVNKWILSAKETEEIIEY